jgi:protein-L-isoaspartate(D-aspartate) O-methyltransferase
MAIRRLSLRNFAFAALVAAAVLPTTRSHADDPRQAERDAMVAQIMDIATSAGPIAGRASISPKVLGVMTDIPRHEFVPEDVRRLAYADRPLPIGFGQTISQPYIVALMTDLLDLEASDHVLEIGTGSGYQAAVLSPLVADVATIEIVPGLALEAAMRLQELGYANVAAQTGDGYYGWPDRAPFDAIVVTAAASHVPPPLVKQLKPGGRMIIPVGTWFAVQHLLLIEKAADGTVTSRQLLPVRFVPLTGGH